MSKDRCPNCGYCEHCGQSRVQPLRPWYGYQPYPYGGPYIWSSTDHGSTSKRFQSGGTYSSSVASSTYSA